MDALLSTAVHLSICLGGFVVFIAAMIRLNILCTVLSNTVSENTYRLYHIKQSIRFKAAKKNLLLIPP